MTEEQYISIIKYAKGVVKNRPDFFAEDVVNDTLLQWIEAGQEFDAEKIKKEIRKRFTRESHQTGHHGTPRSDIHSETRFCKRCREDKPIAAYYLVHRKNGKREINQYCKECWREYMRARYTPGTKRQRRSVGVRSSKQAWSAYLSERVRKLKDGFSDQYCIIALRHKYKAAYLRENYYIIEQFRQYLVDKQNGKIGKKQKFVPQQQKMAA